MAIPDPHPGLVIRYSYLWESEHAAGREEGVKDRPCAVVLTRQVIADRTLVTVVAVTHTPPSDPVGAIELPASIKRMLGLDDLPSWIVLTEVNDFIWPGPDLTPIPGSDVQRFDYGVLPPGFFRGLRDQMVALIKSHRVTIVPRTE